MEALDSLDGPEAERIVSLQLAALGPIRFARSFALPMAQAIGDAWAEQRLCVASEHLGSALLRSMLGTALGHAPARTGGPVVLFATPAGERHEIGLLIAALTAMGAGASPRYFGADLPAEEVIRASEKIGAAAVALALVALEPGPAEREVRAIREGLPIRTQLWVGGAGAGTIELPEGVEFLRSLEALENRLALLGARGASS